MYLKNEIIEKFQTEAEKIQSKIKTKVNKSIVAGSGIAKSVDRNNIILSIPFDEISVLPKSSVEGHQNELVLYKYRNNYSLIFMGRFHYYEGNSILNICSQIILSKLLNIENVLLTNAAGGLNPIYNVGDLVLVTDFINFTKLNIYHLLNKNYVKNNFKNVNLIDLDLLNLLDLKLLNCGINSKLGTYLMVTGPNYETRAEIRMMRLLGADLVGMSTYFEAQLSTLLGIKVVVASLVTNKAKEISQLVSHEEVTEVANSNAYKIINLINTFTEI